MIHDYDHDHDVVRASSDVECINDFLTIKVKNVFQVFVVVPRRWKSRQEEGRIAEQQEELEAEKRRRRGEDEVDENNKKEEEEEENHHEPTSLGPRSLNGGTRV